MTDNEIKKALECCADSQHCWLCVLRDKEDDCHKLEKYALDLINRQNAEIERLQKVNDSFTDIGKMYSEIKAEAIKEFAERLKEKVIYESKNGTMVFGNTLDNLVKEMVGEE